MDQTQLQQQIALYYSKLPADMQVMFSSMKWMDSLQEISTRYRLTEDQKATLGSETTLVLLGIVDATEYNTYLQNEIAVPADSMTKMLSEINTSIIGTIRPQLTETFQKNAAELTEKTYGGEQKLDERFLSLPKEVQTAISESNYQRELYKIAEKHKLSINEMGALEEATTKVILSMIHPDKYEAELQATISKPKEEIAELAREVNDGVLKSIRDVLKSHWGSKGATMGTTEDEVPLPPYARIPTPETQIPLPPKTLDTASSIYKNSGIEMIEKKDILASSASETDKKISATDNILLMESGIDMLADKLNGITVSKSTVSDHSLPKMQGGTAKPEEKTATAAIVHDQYHEPIE